MLSAARHPKSERIPTRKPASERTAAVSQAVVVLPLVPVIAITRMAVAGLPANACAIRVSADPLSAIRHRGVPKVGTIRSATIPLTPRAIARATSSCPSPWAVNLATNTSPGPHRAGSSWQPIAMMSSQAINRESGKICESQTPQDVFFRPE